MSNAAIEVYTDGACQGNPGPGGWGALLMYNGREKELSGAEQHTTNNRMELTAAIEALAAIKRKHEVRLTTDPFKKQHEIRLTTDSLYLKDGINEWLPKWKRNGWRTANRKPVENQDLWKRLEELVAGLEIDWRWVRGHSGHFGNERADKLARESIERLLISGSGLDEEEK